MYEYDSIAWRSGLYHLLLKYGPHPHWHIGLLSNHLIYSQAASSPLTTACGPQLVAIEDERSVSTR